MTVYAITDTEKGRTGIAPTYLQTTPCGLCRHAVSVCLSVCLSRSCIAIRYSYIKMTHFSSIAKRGSDFNFHVKTSVT